MSGNNGETPRNNGELDRKRRKQIEAGVGEIAVEAAYSVSDYEVGEQPDLSSKLDIDESKTGEEHEKIPDDVVDEILAWVDERRKARSEEPESAAKVSDREVDEILDWLEIRKEKQAQNEHHESQINEPEKKEIKAKGILAKLKEKFSRKGNAKLNITGGYVSDG